MSGQLACLWCGNPSGNTDLCVRCATAELRAQIANAMAHAQAEAEDERARGLDEAEARRDYERAVNECGWLDGPDESDSGY